jgi:hypothetical protein
MVIYTNYVNTISMCEELMLIASGQDSIEVRNARSNRLMAHIPKEHIPRLLQSGKLMHERTTGYPFWRCIIPSVCEIRLPTNIT